jgi:ferritin-like metal-binding protein YciE
MPSNTKTGSARSRKNDPAQTKHRSPGQAGRAVKSQTARQIKSNGYGNNRGVSAANGRSASGAKGRQGGSLLEVFFTDQLKDIYYAEHKIEEALPKMKEAATTEELKEAFEDHLLQTTRHIRRLERVFQSLGMAAEGKKCEAIEGITREAEEIIGSTQEGSLTRDAALIIAAQKVEHYEIATYGGLLQLAITMGLEEAADLLDKTLVEEEYTDILLTDIAESEINLAAECEGNIYSWETQANDAGEQETTLEQRERELADVEEKV